MTFRTLVGAAVIVAIAALARPLDAQSHDTAELPKPATDPPALAAPTAAFDWSMPARTGLDADGNGVIDSLTTREQIDPGRFTVNFDACASSPVDRIQHYRWTINGNFAGEADLCSGFSRDLRQSVYTVTLEIEDDNGSTASITKQVTVRDWLIVAVGDSYGSGEGNPEKAFDWNPGNPEPAAVWQDNRCHRSHFSGQAKAAQQLEDEDPRTSVTLVHLSCTGAQIGGVVDQLSTLPDLIGDREIDALLMSVGGNDVGFSDIIKSCMLTEPCFQVNPPPPTERVLLSLSCGLIIPPGVFSAGLMTICAGALSDIDDPTESAATTFENGLREAFEALPTPKTKDLRDKVESFTVLINNPSRVYWTEYPNSTQDSFGELCSYVPLPGFAFAMLPGISVAEAGWVRGELTRRLNEKVAEKSLEAGWTYVDGIFAGFHENGYCAAENWLRRIQESILIQHDINGTVHPTQRGHDVYRDQILSKLRPHLYSGREGGPRLPQDLVPPIVTGVPDRGPDADPWYNADVTIHWSTTDPVPSSGLPSVLGDTIASTEGLKVHASDWSCDPANNCSRGELGLSIDKTPPEIAFARSSCMVPGTDDWCRLYVEAYFTAKDATSGTASPCKAGPGSTCEMRSVSPRGLDGFSVTIPSGQACDEARNCNPGGITAGPFKIDSVAPKLAPTIAPTSIVLNGAATATPNATDATSGVASESCEAVDTTTPGAHTLTCTATDKAGNKAVVYVPYVVEYSIVGFGKPLPMSEWHAGRTVPIKIALADANGVIGDSEAQALLSPTCRVMFSVSGVQAASACMRYDATQHQFVYNWKLGDQTGAGTISVTISYPNSNRNTVLSMPITITK